jgi:hypothetical protein
MRLAPMRPVVERHQGRDHLGFEHGKCVTVTLACKHTLDFYGPARVTQERFMKSHRCPACLKKMLQEEAAL